MKTFSIVLIILSCACLSQAQETLAVYKAEEQIMIDGKGDELSWKKATAYSFDHFYNVEKPDDRQLSQVKMLWSEENLFFLFQLEDKYITAREKSRDGQPYFDDCAEIFLIPSEEKIDMHLGYEVNLYKASNDFVFLNDMLKGQHLVVKSFNPEFEVAATVDGTMNDNSDIDKGWTMEFAIPLKNFHINGPITHVKPGVKWAFLALRQDRNDAEGDRRSTSTLFKLRKDENVHNPKSFGFMQFIE